MSQPFDPYLRWLGIRDPERPPNHYRLLGIDLLESDPDVIASAADRQMSHIRSFQTGQHAELSQKILNELAAARVCLLKPERKLAYDSKLRAMKTPARATAPPNIASVSTVAAPRPIVAQPVRTVVESPFAEIVEATTTRSTSSRRKRKKQSSLAPIALVATLLFAVAVFGLFALKANQKAQVASDVPSTRLGERKPELISSPVSPADTADSPPKPPPESKNPTVHEEGRDPQVDPVVKTPDPADEPETSIEPAPVELPANAPETEPEEQSATDSTSTEEPPATAEQAPAESSPVDELPQIGPKPPDKNLLAVPSEVDRKTALQRIREVFGKEIDAAKAADAKTMLAETLLAQSTGSKNDPVAEFVVLGLAENLAVGAGNVRLAHRVVDLKAQRFAIDAVTAKADHLFLINRQAKTGAIRETLPVVGSDLVEAALSEANFALASKLSHYLVQVATRDRDREALKAAVARDKLIKESQRSYESARAAIVQLADNPHDQEANYRVGAYLCFVRGDWQRGASRLAKGSDEALRNVAAQEIVSPTVAPRQKELGDAWWNYAIDNRTWSASARSRAQFWYELAVDQLPGLDKAFVEKRLGELASKDSEGNGVAGNKKGSIAVDLAKGVRMSFQRIPAGKFIMGSPNTEVGRIANEVPHPVTITKSFYLHSTEVTLAQWLVVIGNTPPGNSSLNLPVASVDRDACIDFCNRLQKRFAARGFQFRLPTEAEWEYACRAGSSTEYCFGDDARRLSEYAWYRDNSGGAAHAVGLLKPNRWGLYDMHGNVYEWVSDLEGAYDLKVIEDPKGPAAGRHSKRGGAYNSAAKVVRSAYREGHPTGDARAWVGFRVVLVVL